MNLDANLSLIRSGKSPNERFPSIDNRYNFIDKDGNLIPLAEENKFTAKQIAHCNERLENCHLEVELNPKFYREVKYLDLI